MKNLKLLLLLLLFPFINIGEIDAQTFTHDGAVRMLRPAISKNSDKLATISSKGLIGKSNMLLSDISIGVSEWSTFTGTRAGSDLVVTLGDYDASGNSNTMVINDGTNGITFKTPVLNLQSAGTTSFSVFNSATNDQAIITDKHLLLNDDTSGNSTRYRYNQIFFDYGSIQGGDITIQGNPTGNNIVLTLPNSVSGTVALASDIDTNIIRLEVNLTAGQLATLNTVPIEILSAPSTGLVYVFKDDNNSFFLNYGTTTYDFAANISIEYSTSGGNIGNIGSSAINSIADAAFKVREGINGYELSTNEAVQIIATANPSTGDGTAKIVLYYTIEDSEF